MRSILIIQYFYILNIRCGIKYIKYYKFYLNYVCYIIRMLRKLGMVDY